jgi:hypothetical protein
MKTLYRTAFALTKPEAPLTDIHKVAKVCYDWVFEPKPGRPREGLSRPARFQRLSLVNLPSNSWLSAMKPDSSRLLKSLKKVNNGGNLSG